MIARDRRFQEVLAALRVQIDSAFAPGERLPSKRELAALHGVGETTVKRAMKVLASEKRLRVLPSVGCFKSGEGSRLVKRSKLTVGIISRRAADEWKKSEIYPELLAEAERRKIDVVSVPNRHFHRYTLDRNLIELSCIPWNTFDVGLLVEAEQTIRTRDPMLSSHRLLAVDMDATATGIDSICFADTEAGETVARHFLELGHRRFAVTDEFIDEGYPAEPVKISRRFGFEMAIGIAGGMLLPQWRLPVPRRGSAEAIRRMVTATVAGWANSPPARRPTAIFIIDHTPIVYGKLIETLVEHGMRVPRDISVVAVTWGGKFFGGADSYAGGIRLASIDFDLSALVGRTYDAAIQVCSEKADIRAPRQPRLFSAPATLIAGQSTAPPLDAASSGR